MRLKSKHKIGILALVVVIIVVTTLLVVLLPKAGGSGSIGLGVVSVGTASIVPDPSGGRYDLKVPVTVSPPFVADDDGIKLEGSFTTSNGTQQLPGVIVTKATIEVQNNSLLLGLQWAGQPAPTGKVTANLKLTACKTDGSMAGPPTIANVKASMP